MARIAQLGLPVMVVRRESRRRDAGIGIACERADDGRLGRCSRLASLPPLIAAPACASIPHGCVRLRSVALRSARSRPLSDPRSSRDAERRVDVSLCAEETMRRVPRQAAAAAVGMQTLDYYLPLNRRLSRGRQKMNRVVKGRSAFNISRAKFRAPRSFSLSRDATSAPSAIGTGRCTLRYPTEIFLGEIVDPTDIPDHQPTRPSVGQHTG